MKDNKKSGQKAEQLAAHFLESLGMRILERNYRCPDGEIDLICTEGETIVFVEVKAREDLKCGYPGESVTICKQRKICRIAGVYCYREHIPADRMIRFDVVEILGGRIRHIRNAFEYQNAGY